jgi:DNA-directed RNA polymerase specialized sigma24 family protein
MTTSDSREPDAGLGGVSDVHVDAVPIEPTLIDPGLTRATIVRELDFESFYRAERDSVGRALAITLGDADLAREAVDEAMARAYQRWDRVSSLDSPAGWVYRVGLNWSRSIIRRLTRTAPPWVGTAHEAPPVHVADPSVGRALALLSVDHRAVVVCRLLLGWSELDTADALGIRPGTVKSRLSRAIDRLAPLLAPLVASDDPSTEEPR